ncbi:MAG: DUF72 domain-containing protein [Candidatus Bathyarchaeota archaeon]|nr:DUF72 domain-containing protein [Candidatus Bathyarchaeota archaeon]MCX8177364.1 DUF72 domain-containing protein [Candidatus Bathyarchaeota archaeon]MDW8193809.1 DUF72 domain-containing protein [Nitrososphaerota archaeon]
MIKVGCCGFPTSMKRYFENYGLVEINSTFYEYPKLETVERWRRNAPENFEFTVKAHQDISHRLKMKLNEACLQAFEYMKQICKILNSKVLLIQTPGSFRPDRLEDAEKFFINVSREDLALAWETRGPEWCRPDVYDRMRKVLGKLEVVHVTDPLVAMPAFTGKITYFRLHGLGEKLYYYQYSDEELTRLWKLIEPLHEAGKKVYLLFNNLSMFEDGVRFMHYIRSGVFPKVTGSAGLDSVRRVVEKTRYPIPKSTLIRKVGWRLVEIEEGKQIRLVELLEKLPSKSFKTPDELVEEIAKQIEAFPR